MGSFAGAGRTLVTLGPSVAQQEREFQRAVQPDSPLSTLLSFVLLASVRFGNTKRANHLGGTARLVNPF